MQLKARPLGKLKNIGHSQTVCKRITRPFTNALEESKMNLIIRVVVCACLLLAFATQQLPQTPQQRESGTGTSQAAASPAPSPGPGGTSLPNADPFPSTYKPFPRRTTLIRNATIMTAAGPTIANGSVLLRDGKIAAVGASEKHRPML